MIGRRSVVVDFSHGCFRGFLTPIVEWLASALTNAVVVVIPHDARDKEAMNLLLQKFRIVIAIAVLIILLCFGALVLFDLTAMDLPWCECSERNTTN